MAPTTEYYVLNTSPHLKEIVEWLDQHGEWYEIHLNRTRFKLEPGRTRTEFLLRYSQHIGLVDTALGYAIQYS